MVSINDKTTLVQGKEVERENLPEVEPIDKEASLKVLEDIESIEDLGTEDEDNEEKDE